MGMKKGDVVGVTVRKDWSDALGNCSTIHYFPANETPTARLFVATLISQDHFGLWVEAVEGFRSPEDTEYPSRLFVPWQFIFAIQTDDPASSISIGFLKR